VKNELGENVNSKNCLGFSGRSRQIHSQVPRSVNASPRGW